MPVDVALAVLQGLRATMLDPRLLKALLVAGAPLRLAIAANIWAGRSLRCASASCFCTAPCAAACIDLYLQARLPPGRFTSYLVAPSSNPPKTLARLRRLVQSHRR